MSGRRERKPLLQRVMLDEKIPSHCGAAGKQDNEFEFFIMNFWLQAKKRHIEFFNQHPFNFLTDFFTTVERAQESERAFALERERKRRKRLDDEQGDGWMRSGVCERASEQASERGWLPPGGVNPIMHKQPNVSKPKINPHTLFTFLLALNAPIAALLNNNF